MFPHFSENLGRLQDNDFQLPEILTTLPSPKHGEWRGRLILPVYKPSKPLPGQLMSHFLVNAINIHNCFSRERCKENVFPTAEDMKGRIQNMKKYLDLLHCFMHKLSVPLRISLCTGSDCATASRLFPVLVLFMVQKQIN